MDSRDERNLQQVYRSAVSGLYARIRSNYDFLYKKYGDDGLKLISEMSREYGLSIAARAKAKLKDNDLASVAQYLIRIFDTVGRGKEETVKPVVWEDTRVIITVGECPLRFTIPGMCLAHTTMERTVVETLNPRLTYRIGKSIPAGNAFCEHIIEIK
jgi:hypothetical protein